MLSDQDRLGLAELTPVLRRAAGLDRRALARVRLGPGSASVLVRLPFGVLVSRTVRTTHDAPRTGWLDLTVLAVDALAWLDDLGAGAPAPRDSEWRGGRPPDSGWQRIESVPDDVIRTLVRQGAQSLKEAAARAGAPGAQPRAEVTDALLDSTVLTVADERGAEAAISLRALSALTRMGFLPRGSNIFVDTAGRWIRVVGGFGTVYLERAGQTLTVR